MDKTASSDSMHLPQHSLTRPGCRQSVKTISSLQLCKVPIWRCICPSFWRDAVTLIRRGSQAVRTTPCLLALVSSENLLHWNIWRVPIIIRQQRQLSFSKSWLHMKQHNEIRTASNTNPRSRSSTSRRKKILEGFTKCSWRHHCSRRWSAGREISIRAFCLVKRRQNCTGRYSRSLVIELLGVNKTSPTSEQDQVDKTQMQIKLSLFHSQETCIQYSPPPPAREREREIQSTSLSTFTLIQSLFTQKWTTNSFKCFDPREVHEFKHQFNASATVQAVRGARVRNLDLIRSLQQEATFEVQVWMFRCWASCFWVP